MSSSDQIIADGFIDDSSLVDWPEEDPMPMIDEAIFSLYHYGRLVVRAAEKMLPPEAGGRLIEIEQADIIAANAVRLAAAVERALNEEARLRRLEKRNPSEAG